MQFALEKCKGRHRSMLDLIPEEECFLAGSVIEEKRGSKAMELKKYILREVLPEGNSGKKFALFIMGFTSSLSVRIDDIFVIHNPKLSKSHLIKHLDLLNHKYEDQIIVQQEIINVHNIASEDKKVIELLEFERLQLVDSETEEGNELQSMEFLTCKRIHSQEELSDGINSERGSDHLKKIKTSDDSHVYTKLKDIEYLAASVNLIGIIRSVEAGTQLSDGERFMRIYIEDESIRGGKFQLNLISRVIDVPPLHHGYILKASNVMVQKVGKDISGWLSSGKCIATIDSDLETPITLLTTQIDPDLTDEDKNRINELREFLSDNSCNYALSSESEKSVSDTEEKQGGEPNQRRKTIEKSGDDSNEECSLRLYLSSSESEESPYQGLGLGPILQ